MSKLENLPKQGILINKMHAFLRKERDKEIAVLKSMDAIRQKAEKLIDLAEQELQDVGKFLDISPKKIKELGYEELANRLSKSLQKSDYKDDLPLRATLEKIEQNSELSLDDKKLLISSIDLLKEQDNTKYTGLVENVKGAYTSVESQKQLNAFLYGVHNQGLFDSY